MIMILGMLLFTIVACLVVFDIAYKTGYHKGLLNATAKMHARIRNTTK